MNDIKRILVVSRLLKHCRRAVRYGLSLAQKYGAELYVMGVVYDPVTSGRWNLPVPSLEKEHEDEINEAKEELHAIVDLEKRNGTPVKELIREGNDAEAIMKVVEEEGIDLLITSSHEESRLEHTFFGHSLDELVRLMPCSVFIVRENADLSVC